MRIIENCDRLENDNKGSRQTAFAVPDPRAYAVSDCRASFW